MSDVAKEAWRKYLIQLQVNPLRTKVVFFCCFFSLLDQILFPSSWLLFLCLEFVFLFLIYCNFTLSFMGVSAGINFWGYSWVRGCTCSKDFWHQEASVKKIASFQCKAGGLFFSLVFFPYSHLGFLLGNERREFWWDAYLVDMMIFNL